MRKKEEAMHDLHQTREALETKMDGLRRHLYYIFFLHILQTYTIYIVYALYMLHQTREALETKLGGLRRAFAEADSRCKLYMGENDRLQKELVTMREVLRCTCFTS